MRRRKSVIVELTSLLDVIFIMLFMVMSRSQTAAEEAQEKAAESVAQIQAEAELTVSGYEDDIALYQSMLAEVEEERRNIASMQNEINSFEQFREMSEIITVYVFDSGYKRSVNIETGDKTESIDFDWDNMDYAREKLADTLNGLAGGTEHPVFIIFNYNGDLIYRRDYNMVTEVITEVQGGYDKVYIKFNDTSDERTVKNG